MTDSSSTILVPSWVAATVAVVAFSTILGSTAFGGTAVDAPPAVTYATDIAPIIARECLSCHTPDGSAPFSLLTYEDVRSRAERIAESVEQGSMPPWLPESEPGTFQGERRLTAEEVDLLRQWADEQAPAGDLTAVATYAGEPEWDPGPPDLIVKLPALTVPADGRDRFWNLVVPIPLTETRWVEAIELRPGTKTVVHHARLRVDTTSSSRDLADQDENPGFDGNIASAASSPRGHFLGWTPGRTRLPPLEGITWRLDPGTDLVVQAIGRGLWPGTVRAGTLVDWALDEKGRSNPHWRKDYERLTDAWQILVEHDGVRSLAFASLPAKLNERYAVPIGEWPAHLRTEWQRMCRDASAPLRKGGMRPWRSDHEAALRAIAVEVPGLASD